LQWVMYFAITNIVVLCISKVPRYCNDIWSFNRKKQDVVILHLHLAF
jgi:hypothetical protein